MSFTSLPLSVTPQDKPTLGEVVYKDKKFWTITKVMPRITPYKCSKLQNPALQNIQIIGWSVELKEKIHEPIWKFNVGEPVVLYDGRLGIVLKRYGIQCPWYVLGFAKGREVHYEAGLKKSHDKHIIDVWTSGYCFGRKKGWVAAKQAAPKPQVEITNEITIVEKVGWLHSAYQSISCRLSKWGRALRGAYRR